MYNGCVGSRICGCGWVGGLMLLFTVFCFVLLLFVCWMVGGVGEWVDWIYVQVAVMSIIKIVYVCNN